MKTKSKRKTKKFKLKQKINKKYCCIKPAGGAQSVNGMQLAQSRSLSLKYINANEMQLQFKNQFRTKI